MGGGANVARCVRRGGVSGAHTRRCIHKAGHIQGCMWLPQHSCYLRGVWGLARALSEASRGTQCMWEGLAVHTQGGAYTRRCRHKAVHTQGGARTRRCIHKAGHTQGVCSHRSSVVI